MREHLLVR